jgi:hypothetical protein
MPNAGAYAAEGPEDDVRITLRISPRTRSAIEEIQHMGGFRTAQEAVRRAIADELFLLTRQREGWTVLLKKDEEYRELVWPDVR